MDRVDAWIGAPAAVLVSPGPQHSRILRGLLQPLTTAGNLVNDAHLAALALGHRCRIVSFDNDFSPFAGVQWSEPG